MYNIYKYYQIVKTPLNRRQKSNEKFVIKRISHVKYTTYLLFISYKIYVRKLNFPKLSVTEYANGNLHRTTRNGVVENHSNPRKGILRVYIYLCPFT